jgi:Ohr subfamily peroxiredoxin
MALDKVLYTAHTITTGGREGMSRSSDGALQVRLTTPKELGGTASGGTNPEQLFAAAYSACFIGALKAAAAMERVAIPADTSVAADVGIGPIPTGFAIQVQLNISMPGMDRMTAKRLIDAAHEVCPYSNATRGNIDVDLNLV